MRTTTLERLCFAVLFAATVGSWAAATRFSFAWVFVLPAAVSFIWRPENVPPSLQVWSQRILWLFVAVTVVLGWIVMAYPVLDAPVVRLLSLVFGCPLLLLGGFFLLGSNRFRPTLTFLPATLSVMVLASFDNVANLHPYLLAAGVAAFVLLASGTLRGHVSWKRWVALGLSAGFVFSVSFTIIRSLPWAQGKVEETMVELYTNRSSGFSGQSAGGMLGELERLKLSQRVVLRMWSREPRKLRGRVSTAFNGKRWYGTSQQKPLTPASSPLVQEEATQKWLDDLPGQDFLVSDDGTLQSPRPVSTMKIVRTDNGTGAVLLPTGSHVIRASVDRMMKNEAGIVYLRPLSSLRIYGVVYGLDPEPVEVSDGYLEECRTVPEDTDPRLIELAGRLAEGATTAEERFRRTVGYVSSAAHYSLDVGEFRTNQPVAEFLLEKKRGYCEYFASAAALLLRLQGVPTRYVGGFNVIESNRKGDHFVVRESDSHAWIEAYIPGRGWVEADPTPAAEYESLHADLSGGWFAETLERVKAAVAELNVRLRAGDWKWIMGVLRSPFLLVPVLLVLGTVVVRRLRRKLRWRRRRPAHEMESPALPPELIGWMARLDREWKKRGVARPATRAPLEHVLGLPADKLTSEIRDTSLRVIDSYYRAAFRGDSIPDEDLVSLRQGMKKMNRR